jgi:hypothetical protein
MGHGPPTVGGGGGSTLHVDVPLHGAWLEAPGAHSPPSVTHDCGALPPAPQSKYPTCVNPPSRTHTLPFRTPVYSADDPSLHVALPRTLSDANLPTGKLPLGPPPELHTYAKLVMVAFPGQVIEKDSPPDDREPLVKTVFRDAPRNWT